MSSGRGVLFFFHIIIYRTWQIGTFNEPTSWKGEIHNVFGDLVHATERALYIIIIIIIMILPVGCVFSDNHIAGHVHYSNHTVGAGLRSRVHRVNNNNFNTTMLIIIIIITIMTIYRQYSHIHKHTHIYVYIQTCELWERVYIRNAISLRTIKSRFASHAHLHDGHTADALTDRGRHAREKKNQH